MKSNQQTSRRQHKVSIYWDYENIPKPQISNYLLSFASSRGKVENAKVYSKWGTSQNKVKKQLETDGWECSNVLVSIRNAVDFQLVFDCGSDNSDIIILVSGDGYNQILLDQFKTRKKEVIVFARQGSVSKDSKECANEFYFIDELPELVNKHNQKLSAVDKCKLTYNDAIMCLIQTVKTALNKGQGTGIGYINQLMSQLFPNYQGVSCICKPTGNNFSKFGDFVKAAVEDGKIRMENQQLFLTE